VGIRTKRGKTILFIILVSLCLIAYFVWENNSLMLTEAEYSNPKIPKEFDGFVIAQVSDLHSKEFGAGQKALLDLLKSASPDIIVVTGDLIDRRRFDLDAAMRFIDGAVKIAPVYYVSGNHEAWSNKYGIVRHSLLDAGVHVLDDAMAQLTAGQSSIHLLGVCDPGFFNSEYSDGADVSRLVEMLRKWSSDTEFKILLSHRPELFDLYARYNMDLIFAGHAHGGQIRLPLIGGILAPNQGLFPKYTTGSYTQGDSTMFVSRGLGNSIVPVRIFNRPEIVVVTLRSAQSK
jgi:predicted MPP superfamily phosphohydrolase